MTINEAKINVLELEAQVATATEAEDAIYEELKALQTRLSDARAKRFEAEEELRVGRVAKRNLEMQANIASANALDFLSMDDYWPLANAIQDATRSTKCIEWTKVILGSLEQAQVDKGMRFEHLTMLTLDSGKCLSDPQMKRVWAVLEKRCPRRSDNGNWRNTLLGTPYPVKLHELGFVEPEQTVEW